CLGDARVNLEAEFIGPLPAQVALGVLIDVHGYHVEPRLLPFAFRWVADEEAVAHVLPMTLHAEFGRDNRHFLPPRALFRALAETSRCQAGAGGAEEGSA